MVSWDIYIHVGNKYRDLFTAVVSVLHLAVCPYKVSAHYEAPYVHKYTIHLLEGGGGDQGPQHLTP